MCWNGTCLHPSGKWQAYYCRGLHEISQFGGTDAESKKNAFDDVFTNKVKLSDNNFKDRLVSITADGASMNTSKYNYVFTRFGEEILWMISLHCFSHHAELAA